MRKITDIEVHFWSRVDQPSLYSCWEWQGSISKGYGSIGVKTYGTSKAHRFAYENMVGPISEELEIDHLCQNKACVNPLHLEAVTHWRNTHRGEHGAHQLARTHCPQGHAYDEANTYYAMKPNGKVQQRMCRACARDRARRTKQRIA